jgi:hypothetical protein
LSLLARGDSRSHRPDKDSTRRSFPESGSDLAKVAIRLPADCGGVPGSQDCPWASCRRLLR